MKDKGTPKVADLKKGQLAALTVNFLPFLEAEAKKRQSKAGGNPLIPKVGQANKGKSRDKAAKQFKTNLPKTKNSQNGSSLLE